MTGRGPAVRRPTARESRDLAVVLHDLAWLLPRTIGVAAARAEPQPPTALEVMRLLSRRPGLSVNDVARELGIAANNVSTAVTHLERQGLLERRRDPVDGRVARLHPTPTAKEARLRRETAWGEAMRDVLASAPAEDAALLVAAAPALHRLADLLADRDGG
jgi:DNA-binding MarR family transcriptional regulator